jgi:hypothetical protein
MRHAAFALSLLLTFTATAADLRGVVRTASNEPLRNAHVYVYAAYPKTGISTICPNCYLDCGKREATDAKGRFVLKGLDDSLKFELLAVADGYDPQFLRNVTEATAAEITLTPRDTADDARLITGVVLDPKGKPIAGAVVEPSGYRMPARELPNGKTTRAVGYGRIPGLELLSVTNEKGEFALKMPDAGGLLDVRVTARSYAPKIDRELAPKQNRTIQVAEGVLIAGRVMNGDKPLAAVPVKIVQRDRASANFLGFYEIGTDKDGRFAVPNLGTETEWAVFVPRSHVTGGVIHPKFVTTGGPKSMHDIGTLAVSKGRMVSGVVHGEKRPAGVVLWNRDTGESWNAKLAENGAFAFNDVTAGALRLGSPGVRFASDPESKKKLHGPAEVTLAAEGDLANVNVYVVE